MNVLIFGLLIFTVGFFLHVLIWRISVPRRQKTALLAVFFGVLIAAVISLENIEALNIWEGMHVCLFVISLTLAYIITYSAIDAESPSLTIIMGVAKAGESGLGRNELEGIMSDEQLIIPRVKDLMEDGLIYLDWQRYRLTCKGAWFIRPFVLYRGLLNIKKGG